MADAVPVSDVLCEATEYLSKLGSNLRVRTESLKDKRIRKDKLQNVHAVRKAANKVLLICDLSKKSIENVESGIQKILAQVSASQTSEDGGKRKKGESSKSVHSTKFEYFVYNSRKLKIRKKVNLKHYMSVKVKATALSDDFQDKYPVYHDCKLYRIRKRKDKEKSKEIDNVIDENQEENSDTNVSKTDDVDHMSGTDTPVIDSEIERNKNKNCKDSLLSNSIEGDKDNVNDESDKQCTSLLGEDTTTMHKDILENFEKEVPTNPESNDNKLSDERKKSKTSKADSKHKTKEKSKKTRFKHIKVLDDSSESEKGSVKSISATEDLGIQDNSVQNSSTTESVACESNALCDNEGNEKQSDVENNEMTVDTSAKQCNENKNINNDGENNSDNELENNSEIENPKKKRKLSTDESNHSDNSNIEHPVKENLDNVEENHEEDKVCENKKQPDSSSHQNENSEMKAETRPLIKCVNISKLLKDDCKTKYKSLLGISDNENEIDKHKQKKSKSSKNEKNKHSKKDHKIKEKLDKNKKSTTSDDEEYWKEKRKEVKKFISKKFHISITRMPKLSEKYLAAHHIVRVIQNGIVLSERPTTPTSKDSNTNSDIDKNAKETEKAICDMDVVKNALLNDSDSDKSDSELIAKTKETIDGFLNNSKSDNSDNEKASNKSKSNNKSLSGNDADILDANNTNHMDKQKTPEPEVQKSKSDVETEIVKSSLMKDSSDEILEQSDSKKRRESNSITPSKRKHIMESMHAKKMLLTYSSSSDTEDEQLRNALKEIRNSLLQESIEEPKKSNEESVSEEKRKSDKSQSESEELESKNIKDRKKSETEKNNQSDSSAKSSKRSSKGSAEENSNSSSKKMNDGNGSSNINSDIEDQIDKDIDGLTNLKTLNKRQRRRRSSSSEGSQTHKTLSKMPKAPQISKESFLKAESSSDEASAVESDVPGEEMPTVPASGLNGDAMSHLAKDDLLGDSDDTSSEKNTSQQDTQNNDSSDENVTKKRRKALAILSDTEVGSSRKKNRDVKMSDFEDSEDENSEPVKRSKRKKKGSDSDASVSSSIDGTKKKRKRIKNIDDSDCSDSESETEGKNKHGRKNIRKVMGKNQLEEATKKAAREEKERIARIAERQKLYNNLEFDETGKPDEVVLDKVVLDFDPETKEPLIEVDKGLVKKLKPHQANGIKFMWNACFESVKRIKKDKGSGCILAHCMGLGKTLQVVTLTHTLLTHGDLTGVRRVLVVCPLSTVLNWVNEFRMWLKHTQSDYELDVYELSRYKQNTERACQLHQWFTGGGVCVLGYEMFRNLSADNNKKFKKKMLRDFQQSLVDPGPDLVVCDEGHLLKNEKTSLSQAMNRICTLRRIVLTGTPLQNNLKEYYCMVQFVKPNLLGKYNEYLNRFVNPITNGQYTDSTEHDIRIMKRRSHVLHKMLDGAVQRRDYGVLAPFLPPKHEYVLFITLTDVQIKLYQEYLDNYSRRPSPGKSSGFLFPDFQSLQRIWTHPLVLKYNSERYEIMQQKKREREEEDSEGSLVDFIDDDSTPDESSSEDSTDDSSDMSDDSRKKSKKKKSGKKAKGKASARRATRANPIEAEEVEEPAVVEEVKAENPTEWWIRLVGDEELEDLRNSHKLVLLFDILRQCETIGDKLLVFSQSLYSLDLIEHFLGKVDEATQEGRVDEKLNGHVGSWSPGVDYFRLDGSTSCENRSIWCKNFNREDNPRARLFLISTRAGGLGINLVAANRVVIFDVSWNPSHDVQSIFRVYRFGQKKPCYVYRFLAMGTMEEKIYERQVTKQAISKRVIDEQQIDRHYAENDLAELYKFEPRPEAPRELPPLPKDRLFAEMLREHEAQIYKYHEHDSLLENKEEETLTEEERKAAWEDFENEKTRPPPAPFPGPYGMHNGMVPGLLAQQQQLAYAALAAMLRKDMPNINDNQIRDMLPLIYQANPGLMQKMSEIYKYTQPGMMNPGMMNPAMNTAGAGGMGMGGSSGLQYEPPWQRQQQQQQQMRLQQLLQQQQNMGAKFYAGGLGSRDPVAMALQQQRAREMMLGERQRPRGRPPARSTPQASGDVVNLDSD